VFKKFFSIFYLFQCFENLKATIFDHNSLQFLMIMENGSKMRCIFHFFVIKLCQFFEVEQDNKVIMSLRISFDRYMILI